MISRVHQKVFSELFDPTLVTILGLPPKDPNDEDEDEKDEGDDEEEEPAVIREPDE